MRVNCILVCVSATKRKESFFWSSKMTFNDARQSVNSSSHHDGVGQESAGLSQDTQTGCLTPLASQRD